MVIILHKKRKQRKYFNVRSAILKKKNCNAASCSSVQTNSSQPGVNGVSLQSVVTACIVALGDQLGISVYVCIYVSEWDSGIQECWVELHVQRLCVWYKEKPTHSVLKASIHGGPDSSSSLHCQKKRELLSRQTI